MFFSFKQNSQLSLIKLQLKLQFAEFEIFTGRNFFCRENYFYLEITRKLLGNYWEIAATPFRDTTSFILSIRQNYDMIIVLQNRTHGSLQCLLGRMNFFFKIITYFRTYTTHEKTAK